MQQMQRVGEDDGGATLVAIIVACMFVLLGVFIGWKVSDYLHAKNLTKECIEEASKMK